MPKKIAFIFSLLVAVLAFLYRDSFTAGFFQDDFYLLQLSKTENIFAAVPFFPYRPISVQIFYGLGSTVLGSKVFGFHLALFFAFVIALVFLYLLVKKILGRTDQALTAAFLYAFNISLFPLFYWIAISYFVFAALFTFSCCYFFLERGKAKYLLSIILFMLGLLSNEIVMVVPALLIFLYLLIKNIDRKKLIPFIVIDVLYLFLRLKLAAFPKAADYAIEINLKFFSTARWYWLRVLNLPEGRAAAGIIIYSLFALLLLLVGIVTIKKIRSRAFPLRPCIFSVLWFFAGAAPFFFLPNHMSAYYLTLSLFGPAVFLAKLFGDEKKLTILFLCVFLAMSFVGLNALSLTHWIILKPPR